LALEGEVVFAVVDLAFEDGLAATNGFAGSFFLSSLAFALAAGLAVVVVPGLAALTTVFFFLTVGLLSVDPVTDRCVVADGTVFSGMLGEFYRLSRQRVVSSVLGRERSSGGDIDGEVGRGATLDLGRDLP